jgi:RimJ/RimL family protein N-acetyltransferase
LARLPARDGQGSDVHFVVRLKTSQEFLGMAGLHKIRASEPEAGIWIKEAMHGKGYGREAVAAVVSFAASALGKKAVLYPVAEVNGPSRRLAQSLDGKTIGKRLLRKSSGIEYPEVVYRIPVPLGGTPTSLRAARPEDFDYCARLYFEGMENIIKELNLNMEAQIAGFRQRWDVTEVRIITLDRTDIGWLQSFLKDDTLFLAQLFVDGALRGQGIGTEVVNGLVKEAARVGRAVTLGVVKTNPALRVYRRLGFRTTHEDERKFYMRRD